MPLLGATGGGSAKGFGALANLGYFIRNSLRFRGSNSAYLRRTPGVAGNLRTWTASFWYKNGALNTNETLFSNAVVSDSIGFRSSRTLEIYFGSGSANLLTSQSFRDTAAWYHIVVAVDTTQATSSNRIKLYVNGSQVTAFSSSTYPTQNYQTSFNRDGFEQEIGRRASNTDYPLDGYMAEVNWVDGQQLTPSDFGKTDAATGQWIPKKFAGTYGTNGYYLKFSDIALTSGSNAGLGKDFSGNGNYFNTNNISVTAGGNYDAMIDSPTLSAAASNYAVWNPLDSTLASISGGTREANLTIGNGVDLVIRAVRATFQLPTTGKWYWECIWSNTTSTSYLGIGTAATSLSANLGSSSIGYSYNPNGNKFNNNSSSSYGNTFTNGDVIGVAFDSDNGKLYFSKNGTWQASGDPVAGTNAAFTGLTSGPYFPMCSVYYGDAWVCTFGQRPFAYTPPTGFKALNTFNLP